jgi:predicted HAD superfamily Cof-like phosphohydrolase
MYNDVVKFIEACDQECSPENVHLYRGLIAEEYDEFCDAVVMRDKTEQLDACMDMIWVILGYCYMKGYNVEGAWNEVARSNLDKIDSSTGKVIKREDGKVLKPEGWTPPQLEQFTK